MPTVSIEGFSKLFQVDEEETLFDALDNCGHELPHSCLAGTCGTCKVIILTGQDNLSPPSELEKMTIQAIKQNYNRIHGENSLANQTIRLACQAKILQGDVKIKILN